MRGKVPRWVVGSLGWVALTALAFAASAQTYPAGASRALRRALSAGRRNRYDRAPLFTASESDPEPMTASLLAYPRDSSSTKFEPATTGLRLSCDEENAGTSGADDQGRTST